MINRSDTHHMPAKMNFNCEKINYSFTFSINHLMIFYSRFKQKINLITSVSLSKRSIVALMGFVIIRDTMLKFSRPAVCVLILEN